MSSNYGGGCLSGTAALIGGIAALIAALTGLYLALRPSTSGPTPVPQATQAPAQFVPTTAPPPVQPAPTTAPPVQPPPPNTPVPPSGFRIVDVTLDADPATYNGACPAMIRFSGRISVTGGSGTVTYKFLRSDGAIAPIQTLRFTGPGSQSVTTSWQLGISYDGWEQIQILTPSDIQSNQATFSLRCR